MGRSKGKLMGGLEGRPKNLWIGSGLKLIPRLDPYKNELGSGFNSSSRAK